MFSVNQIQLQISLTTNRNAKQSGTGANQIPVTKLVEPGLGELPRGEGGRTSYSRTSDWRSQKAKVAATKTKKRSARRLGRLR